MVQWRLLCDLMPLVSECQVIYSSKGQMLLESMSFFKEKNCLHQFCGGGRLFCISRWDQTNLPNQCWFEVMGFCFLFPSKTNESETVCPCVWEYSNKWTDSPEKFWRVWSDHNRFLGIQALLPGSESTTQIKIHLEDNRILGFLPDSQSIPSADQETACDTLHIPC